MTKDKAKLKKLKQKLKVLEAKIVKLDNDYIKKNYKLWEQLDVVECDIEDLEDKISGKVQCIKVPLKFK